MAHIRWLLYHVAGGSRKRARAVVRPSAPGRLANVRCCSTHRTSNRSKVNSYYKRCHCMQFTPMRFAESLFCMCECERILSDAAAVCVSLSVFAQTAFEYIWQRGINGFDRSFSSSSSSHRARRAALAHTHILIAHCTHHRIKFGCHTSKN